MWIFVAALCQAILIGWLAQKELKRTGAVWFAIALAMDVALIVYTDSVTREYGSPRDLALRGSFTDQFGTFMMSVGITTLVMGVVLWTLPKVKTAPEDAANR